MTILMVVYGFPDTVGNEWSSMAFSDRVANLVEELGIGAMVVDTPAEREDFQSIIFSRGEKRVVLRCRHIGTKEPDTVALMIAAFRACQAFDECDDFLEWVETYQLKADDAKVLHEFRELDAAQWQFRDLLGESLFQELMAGIEIEQAINAAAAGFDAAKQDG